MGPHGELHFTIDDRILIIEGHGPWNKEAMTPDPEQAQVISRFNKQSPWGVLVIIHGDPVHTPDAAKLLIELVKRDKREGRIASALILDNSSAPSFGRQHIADLYRAAGEEFAFFDSATNAKRWLLEQLEQEQLKETQIEA